MQYAGYPSMRAHAPAAYYAAPVQYAYPAPPIPSAPMVGRQMFQQAVSAAPPGSPAYAISQLDVVRDAGQTVSLPGKTPTTAEEFLLLRDRLARTPEGGALLFAVAQYIYTNVDDRLGTQCLTLILDASHVAGPARVNQIAGPLRAATNARWRGHQPEPRVLRDMNARCGRHKNVRFDKSHLPRSLFLGTSPENGYAPPTERPLAVLVKRQRADAGEPGKIFLHCTGSDLPKPVRMRRNQKGVWKALEWSSLQASVRPPRRPLAHEADCL
jgi:hypothetical protein